MSDEKKPKEKRDWLELFIDVGAALIICGAVAMVLGVIIWMFRLMRIIP